MQLTRLLRVDTYASAKNELRRLFNNCTCVSYNVNELSLHSQHTMTSKLEKNVRQYLLHTSDKLKRLPSLAPLQSWIRGNVNMLLCEARVRCNGPIALAALQVILSEERYLPNVEVAWLKDVLAACTTAAEVEQFKKLISQYSCNSGATNEVDSNTKATNKVKRSRIQGDVVAMLYGGIQVKENSFKKLAAHVQYERSPELNNNNILDSGNNTKNIESNLGECNAQNSLNHANVENMDAESKYLALLAENDKALQNCKEQEEQLHQQQLREKRKAHVAHAFASYSPEPYAKSIYSPSERALMGMNYLQQHYYTSNSILVANGKDNGNNNGVSVLTSPNQSFIRYFQKQGIVRSETEVMSLFHAMQQRKEFQSFRIVPSQSSCPALTSMLHTILHNRPGIHRVDWLPVEYETYVLNCAKDMNYDTLLRNRQLLTSLCTDGVISFQGISSILPVLFLQPELHDRILDLCAAPGGKTALILDILSSQRKQQQEEEEEKHHHSITSRNSHNTPNSVMSSTVQDGCVIANEADRHRANVLASRLSHYKSSYPSLTITSVPGECFALSALPANHLSNTNNNSVNFSASTNTCNTISSSGSNNNSSCISLQIASAKRMRFDKILVDAPCSGEGQLGKDHQQWRLWHPRRSFQFVDTQLNLLATAIQCCEAGGVVVYSTCTLNPIENEAVVAEVLRWYGDCVELVEPAYPRVDMSSVNFSKAKETTRIRYNNNKNTEKVNAKGNNSNIGEYNLTNDMASGGYTSANDATDCFLPPIVLRHGLRSWFVPSREGGFYQTTHDAVAHNEWICNYYGNEDDTDSNSIHNYSNYKKRRNGYSLVYGSSSNKNKECLLSMMFAPHCADEYRKVNNDETNNDKEIFDKDSIHQKEAFISEQLHRCCRRILPHDNHGAEGFFIAVIRVKRLVSLTKAIIPRNVSLKRVQEFKMLSESSPYSGNDDKTQSLFSNKKCSSSGGDENFVNQPVSLSSVSLLHTRGLMKLNTSPKSLIYTLLSPFFTEIEKTRPSQRSLSANHNDGGALFNRKESKKHVHGRILHFLSSQQLSALWHHTEGMRLVGHYTLEWLEENSNWIVLESSQRKGGLLDTGVIVFTAQGEITWQGAHLLRPHITSRLFRLPLAYVQLLLAHRSLTLSDKIVADSTTGKGLQASTFYVHRHGQQEDDATFNLPTWWREIASELCATETAQKALRRENTSNNVYITGSASNAIVQIDACDAWNVDNSITHSDNKFNKMYQDQPHQYIDQSKHINYRKEKVDYSALSSWCLPVKVECHDALHHFHVSFQLLLDDTSRHMCQGLLNRFLSSSRHCLTTRSVKSESAQSYLHKSQEYNVSNIMSPSDLFGVNPNAHEVNRRLFANTRVGAQANIKAHEYNSSHSFDQNKQRNNTIVEKNETEQAINNIVEV